MAELALIICMIAVMVWPEARMPADERAPCLPVCLEVTADDIDTARSLRGTGGGPYASSALTVSLKRITGDSWHVGSDYASINSRRYPLSWDAMAYASRPLEDEGLAPQKFLRPLAIKSRRRLGGVAATQSLPVEKIRA
jgi:hypothetical protein